MGAALPYRPDIDGLRAIAVLAVVLFHAKVGPFTGGYVGVDVFFVISGFLITSIVVREIESGTFSFANFYERRIRRIFPALFLVIGACLIAGWFALTPNDYKDLATSAINTAIFISNISFNRRAGYFAPAAETQPLLHTWSLAVEEQFYAIAPLALLGLLRISRSQRAAIFLALAAASLAYAAYGVHKEWSSAFYLLQSRAWELMVGMALGLGRVPRIASRATAEAMAALGLIMILAAVVGFTAATPFPGLAALLPCIGAALVIHSGGEAPATAHKVLASSPAVFVGKISYSLYLWHWPLLAFAAYELGDEFPSSIRLALIACAILLAIATWALVEQPARRRRGGASQQRVFGMALATMSVCLLSGYAIKKTGGAIARLPAAAQAFARSIPQRTDRERLCSAEPGHRASGEPQCLLGDRKRNAPSFIFWGDSHALAVADQFSRVAQSQGRKGAFVAIGGCPPFLGLESISARRFAKCIEGSTALLHLLKRTDIRDVIMFARWAVYSESTGSRSETNVSVRRFVDGDVAGNRAEFARLFRQTVKAITTSGRRVTILAPVPELPYNLPSEVIKDMMRGKFRDYSISTRDFAQRQTFVLSLLIELDSIEDVRVLYPDHLLCDADKCQPLEGQIPLYADDDHLSQAGAQRLEPLFQESLTPPPSAKQQVQETR